MGWHDLLFAHWRVDADLLRPLIPPPLELDTLDGEAWIGVVPFRMSDVAPRCVPAMPGISAFPELNVRTYVTCDGKPGVWFFSLDATSRLAVRVARRAFFLPYMDAQMGIQKVAAKPDHPLPTYDYSSRRTHRGEPSANFVAQYGPTSDVWFAETGTLEHWLTARYCLYSMRPRDGQVFRGEIDHPPWQLQNASCKIDTNTMCGPLDIALTGEPHLLFVQDIHVLAWLIEKVA